MNKKIPNKIFYFFIAILSFSTLTACYIANKSISENSTKNTEIMNNNSSATKTPLCKPRAFAGEEKIKGWLVDEGQQKVLRVDDSDFKKLPLYTDSDDYKKRIEKIKIIDATPQIDKKLSASSSSKPQTVTIRGFAFPCKGFALASIEYKDGIFSEYLNTQN